jgi:hypothetical protein
MRQGVLTLDDSHRPDQLTATEIRLLRELL